MDQKPLDGAAPLDPPPSDVALAYLAEATAVRERREQRIDRHSAARQSLVEAVALSLYVTVLMFTLGEPVAGSAAIIMVGVFIAWSLLAGERRESLGFATTSIGSSRAASVAGVVIIGITVAAGLVLQLTGLSYPAWLRFMPGALILVLLGGYALRDLRASAPLAEPLPIEPFTPAARWSTAVFGVVLGLGIWAASSSDSLVSAAYGMALMLSLLIWWSATQISDRVPLLGAVWGVAQWAAFGFGAGLLAVTVLLLVAGKISSTFGAVAGGVCAVAFGVSALLRGRRAS